MDAERIFAGLNPEQRAAVEATRGPVCILAGAGTGKTTTITRRIAWQVASGAFAAPELVAVTFTDKAAGELRARLAALGVEGVRASTFHSAALALLRRFAGDPGRILSTKALLLRQIGNRLPAPYKFRPAGDLATEIEWAKNRRLTPQTYIAALGDHESPLPADLAHRVFREYEKRKSDAGALDFEDLLERTIRVLEEDEHALELVRERWRAFTVDEYQDVNLLQQTLLDLWLGDRDELCAVGDDYQSIYGFTGASAQWLLALPRRYAHAHVVRLEQNYRSTPQVLALANRLVPKLGGAEKTLRATLGDGPEPDVVPNADVAARIKELAAAGVALEDQAVLVRTNARAADFEEAFHEAGIPFQGASLLARDAARRLLKAVQRDAAPPGEAVRQAALSLGLARAAAGEARRAGADAAGGSRAARAAGGAVRRRRAGVRRVAARALRCDVRPRRASADAASSEGARVRGGVSPAARGGRAAESPRRRRRGAAPALRRDHAREAAPARDVGAGSRAGSSQSSERSSRASQVAKRSGRNLDELPPAFGALREWRLERAKADEVPAYVVFHNATLAEIAERQPRTLAELALVPGVGPAKLERYGDDILAALARVA